MDFRNTVIIMTSNLGSQMIQEMAGGDGNGNNGDGNGDGGGDDNDDNYAAMKAGVLQIVAQHFRPEFVNRVDDLVVFRPLAKSQLAAIARIQLRFLRDRLAARDMRLEITDAALAKLAAAGYDPVFGARPLKRAIQTELENPLAQKILSGEVPPGGMVKVDCEGGEFVFG